MEVLFDVLGTRNTRHGSSIHFVRTETTMEEEGKESGTGVRTLQRRRSPDEYSPSIIEKLEIRFVAP
ncbi:hypothetical protein Trydic_g17020 [Trypoxylus dichotomus]